MKNHCVICNCELSTERVEALEFLNTPRNQWACVPHSQVRKVKGVFLGEVGTSQMLRVSGVGPDRVEREEVNPESIPA